MKSVVGMCYIGRHVTNGNYILLRFADDLSRRGVFVHVGPNITISGAQMKVGALPAVLDLLRNTPACDSQRLQPSQKVDHQAMLKLKRNYSLVSVCLNLINSGSEELELVPLHSGHGWQFDSHAEEVRRSEVPRTNEVFLKILDETLEVAT